MYPVSITVRVFIPAELVGPLPDGNWGVGDNRGFSLTAGSSRIEATIAAYIAGGRITSVK